MDRNPKRISIRTSFRSYWKVTSSADIKKEKNWYVVTDRKTGVASQGKTLRKALDNLEEALGLHYLECPPVKVNFSVKLERLRHAQDSRSVLARNS